MPDLLCACMRIAGFSAKKTRGVYAAHAYTPRISQPTLAKALGHVAENSDELHQTALTVERSDLDRLASPIPLTDGERDPAVGQSLDRVARRVGRTRSKIAVRGDVLFKEVNQIGSFGHREELRRGTLPLVRAKANHLTGRRIVEHLERPITASRIDVRAERILAIHVRNRDVVTIPIGDGEVRETALGDSLVRGHFVFRWGLAPVCLPSYYNHPSVSCQVVLAAFFSVPVQHRFGTTTITTLRLAVKGLSSFFFRTSVIRRSPFGSPPFDTISLTA